MRINFYIGLFLFSAFLYSCKSSEKLYNQGRYDEAVELASRKLQKKPGDPKLRELVKDAYRYAVNDHEARIRNFSESNTDLKWESIYHEYLLLQNLYEAIRKSPSVFELVQPIDYSSYITTYREEAATARYERGLNLLNQDSRKGYREAYHEFQKALSLKPDDLAIRRKMEEAFEKATVHILIHPASWNAYQFASYHPDYDYFSRNLHRNLEQNKRSPFLKYHFAGLRSNPETRADFTVQTRISDFSIRPYQDFHQVKEVSKRVLVKETVISKDSIIKEYATVKAKIATVTRTLRADAIMNAMVLDEEGRRIWTDAWRSDYHWTINFSTYTGDERALSEEDKKLLAQKEQWPPGSGEISRILFADLQRKAECGINDYFNRYH